MFHAENVGSHSTLTGGRIFQWYNGVRTNKMNAVYVRFGKALANSRVMNPRTDKYEMGVSVYEALEEFGRLRIVLPKLTRGACNQFLKDSKESAFVVTGEVIGRNTDGKIVLRSCTLVENARWWCEGVLILSNFYDYRW